MASEWIERTVDESVVDALEAAGNSRLLARILALRGVTPETLDRFLHPSMSDIAIPDGLPGVAEVVDRIRSAVLARERIVVFGDYDCDGVASTAIMVKTLSALGCEAGTFIPERLSEGYGMNDRSIARLLAEHPDVRLVVAVDNGINSVDEIARLRRRGVDVVVIDHHLPGPELPDCPIVNPKAEPRPPECFSCLCAAGAAFFVSHALMKRARAEGAYSGGKIGHQLAVLAGLASITDIMPLVGQNRILVSYAISHFESHAPTGLKELLSRASRTTPAEMNSHIFGFLIGPRINAAGRMGSAMDALKLVLATDQEEASELARIVDLRNTERKNVEQTMTAEAKDERHIKEGAAAQVIDLPDGHPGVAGIVAARILEHLAKVSPDGAVPVCVAVGSHGSARAPEGYNLRKAFEACARHLSNYGGHAAAGGFSVKEGELEAFRDEFARACEAQKNEACENMKDAGVPFGATPFDTWVKGSDLTEEFVRRLGSLAPFGEGNPEPLFAMRGVVLKSASPIGAAARHLRLSFGGSVPEAVWWGHGDDIEKIRAGASSPVDILFNAAVSEYGGPHVELRLVAMRPSAEAGR